MPRINANARFDSPLIARAEPTRFLVVTLQAPPAEVRQPPKPLNLALIIDASGSMGGQKLAAAKEAAILVSQQLTERDRLSVVSFASETKVHVDGRVQDAWGRMDAAVQIGGLEPRGNTNLSDGYFAGAECVARGQAAGWEGRNCVVLLSDGMANAGITNPSELEHHSGQLRIRGVTTSTVGIGDDYQPLLLERMAEHGGGRLHDAELPEEIAQVVLGELKDLNQQVADSVTVELNLPAGTECECLGGFRTERFEGGFRTQTGGLLAGLSRELVYKLKFPSAWTHAPGAQVNIRWRSGTEAEGSIELPPIQLRETESPGFAHEQRSTDLAIKVAELWKNSLVKQVSERKYSGDIHDLSAWLDRELGLFAAYGRGVPGADGLLRELKELQASAAHEWDSRTSKDFLAYAFKSTRGDVDHRLLSPKNLTEVLSKTARTNRGRQSGGQPRRQPRSSQP